MNKLTKNTLSALMLAMIAAGGLVGCGGGGGGSTGTDTGTNDGGTNDGGTNDGDNSGDPETGVGALSANGQIAADAYALMRYLVRANDNGLALVQYLVPQMEAAGSPLSDYPIACPGGGTATVNWSDSDGNPGVTMADNADAALSGCIADEDTLDTDANPFIVANEIRYDMTDVTIAGMQTAITLGMEDITAPGGGTSTYVDTADGAPTAGYINRPGNFLENDLDVLDLHVESQALSATQRSLNIPTMELHDYDLGASIYITTPAAITLDDSSGTEVLMAGTFQYQHNNLVIQVQPDADPAYVNIQWDVDNDGSFDGNERALWSDFTDDTLVP